MDLVITGRLEGGAVQAGAYEYATDDKRVLVEPPRVSVTWIGFRGDADDAEPRLQEWFEDELAAQVLATAVPSAVFWDGRTIYEAGEQVQFRVTSSRRFGYSRQEPAQLSVTGAMTLAIRTYPEVRQAARHYRATARLIRTGEDIALGEAYLTVAVLVVEVEGEENRDDWRAFGDRLRAAGEPLDGDDLVQLFASCQWGRHHLRRVAAAELKRIRRERLTWYRTCWRAAEVVEAYVRAKEAGAL